jgi:Flp pilus assembly pilin Flp
MKFQHRLWRNPVEPDAAEYALILLLVALALVAVTIR